MAMQIIVKSFSKADVQYAKKKFAELTNLSVDFPINQSVVSSVIDPNKH